MPRRGVIGDTRKVRQSVKLEARDHIKRLGKIRGAILDATRNETLKTHYRSLAGRILGARYSANLSPERWASAVAEHEDILAALKARDGSRLAALLKSHLAGKLDTVKEHVEGAGQEGQ
jgi:DNA-binding GntR family transcriptional regulator